MIALSAGKSVAGQWRNERGSVLILRVEGTQLSGSYRTAVGNPDPRDDYPVSGIVHGDLLAFSVAWIGHDSLTSWTGRHEAGEDRLRTLWHLVRSHTTTIDPLTLTPNRHPVAIWGAFTTQASVFDRFRN